MTSAETEEIAGWVASELGAQVTSISRQPRWRPVWFVTADRGGEILRLCVRGDRSDVELIFPLEHEMRFQALLADEGVPVPRVHGWIDRLDAFVMDTVAGRPDFGGVSDDERDTVVDEYLQALARIHQLDIAPFVDAGIVRAATPDESGMVGMARFEAVYRREKHQPDPLMSSVSAGSIGIRPEAMGASARSCGTRGSSTTTTATWWHSWTSSWRTSVTR